MNKEVIKMHYFNARELIKLNKPKEARQCVLAILNSSLEYYHSLDSIIEKKKTEEFMLKWINVSKDLYNKGITNNVLESFGLLSNASDCNNISITDDITEQGWCADIFEKYKNAVIKIEASTNHFISNGTGFFVSKGYILTNNHIVYYKKINKYHENIYMILGDKKIKIDLLFCDKDNDIALCQFDTTKCCKYSIIKFIDNYDSLKQGADCLVIGNPFNLGLAPFTGIIKYTFDKNNNLIYQAPSNFGDSGGPVFNRNGECIGINKSKMQTINDNKVDGFALATPSIIIKNRLKEWIG